MTDRVADDRPTRNDPQFGQYSPRSLQELTDALPRVALSTWPTPLAPCHRLGQRLGGIKLYMKREDLSELAFGGNKVRNLEFRMGRARALGCDTLVLARDQHSNNARLTAAAARATGLDMILLVPSTNEVEIRGNRLVQELLGLTVRAVPHTTPADVRQAVADLVAQQTSNGARVYDNDAEDPDAYAVIGWVRAAAELHQQCQQQQLQPAAVYMPGGFSQAGLALGAYLIGWELNLIGVSNLFGRDTLVTKQRQAMTRACELLGVPDVAARVRLDVRDDQLGERLIQVLPAARAAVYLVGETQGVVIEPFYNGRAMAVLADDARTRYRPDDVILYVHTGGTPMIFAAPQLLQRQSTDPYWR